MFEVAVFSHHLRLNEFVYWHTTGFEEPTFIKFIKRHGGVPKVTYYVDVAPALGNQVFA